MYTMNTDVLDGQANASRVFCESVDIRFGERPMVVTLESGVKIRGYLASQVEKIRVRHESKNMANPRFDIKAETFSFSTTLELDNYRQTVGIKGIQFALVSNKATTGHKLQGYTAQSLVAEELHYGENWVYVLLSRVRTMSGLYLREKLSTVLSRYDMPKAMKDMLKKFRETIELPIISEDEYNKMLKQEDTWLQMLSNNVSTYNIELF